MNRSYKWARARSRYKVNKKLTSLKFSRGGSPFPLYCPPVPIYGTNINVAQFLPLVLVVVGVGVEGRLEEGEEEAIGEGDGAVISGTKKHSL